MYTRLFFITTIASTLIIALMKWYPSLAPFESTYWVAIAVFGLTDWLLIHATTYVLASQKSHPRSALLLLMLHGAYLLVVFGFVALNAQTYFTTPRAVVPALIIALLYFIHFTYEQYRINASTYSKK